MFLSKKIQAMKTTNCPKCNFEIRNPYRALRCPQCSNTVLTCPNCHGEDVDRIKHQRCPNCHAPFLKDNEDKCPHCLKFVNIDQYEKCPHCNTNLSHPNHGRGPKNPLGVLRDINDHRHHKIAQSFYPTHSGFSSDQLARGTVSDKQQALIDIVIGNQQEGYSPILDMILKPESIVRGTNINTSDKDLLFKAWEHSKLESDGKRKILYVDSSITDNELNKLKALGLICGFDRNVVLTDAGEKSLVGNMLSNDNISVKKASNAMQKLIVCSSKREVKEDLTSFSKEKLEQIIKYCSKAQKDSKDPQWHEKFDINKVNSLKETAEKILKSR